MTSIQVTRTLQSIIVNFSRAVTWMVLILPLIFSSSYHLARFWGTVPTMIGITFTFKFSSKVLVFVQLLFLPSLSLWDEDIIIFKLSELNTVLSKRKNLTSKQQNVI